MLLRAAVLLVSIIAIAVSNYFVVAFARNETEFPSWMFIFYLAVFAFFWFYSHFPMFDAPLFGKRRIALPRVMLVVLAIAQVLVYFIVRGNAEDLPGFDSRAQLMVIVSLMNVLVGLVAIFGNAHLGVIGRFLKFGNR
ncbi:hypothetical protein ACWKWK_16550 [Pseudoxanthomonas beigongshangi]